MELKAGCKVRTLAPVEGQNPISKMFKSFVEGKEVTVLRKKPCGHYLIDLDGPPLCWEEEELEVIEEALKDFNERDYVLEKYGFDIDAPQEEEDTPPTKFVVGDKVKIREDLVIGEVYEAITFIEEMAHTAGQDATITVVEVMPLFGDVIYEIDIMPGTEDTGWGYSEQMFEEKILQ